jgi:hypothetical protein
VGSPAPQLDSSSRASAPDHASITSPQAHWATHGGTGHTSSIARLHRGQNEAITGSSDIRWGSGYESSGGQEHSEAVVVSVAVAAGQAAVELDDPVDGFGAAIRCALRGEVGQERVAPAAQGPAQSRHFGDRAGVKGRQNFLGPLLTLGQIGSAVGRPQVLGAAPGDVDLLVGFVLLDGSGEPVQLLVGEVLRSGPEDGLDAVERIAFAATRPRVCCWTRRRTSSTTWVPGSRPTRSSGLAMIRWYRSSLTRRDAAIDLLPQGTCRELHHNNSLIFSTSTTNRLDSKMAKVSVLGSGRREVR